MIRSAFFVDLSNFYSHLLKSGIANPDFLRDYFQYWQNFDLLAATLNDSYSGIWVFYSGQKIGPSDCRIDGTYLKEYIKKM